MKTADVVVVGGGLTGAALALGLMEKGVRKVVMFDEQLSTQRLSRANFGLTWFMCKGAKFPAYAQWARKACIAWPEFAGTLEQETGVDLELEWTGGAIPALDEDEFQAHESSIRTLTNICAEHNQDYPVRLLDRKEFQELIPDIGIGPDIRGAMYSPEQGHVNPLKLLTALRCAFQKKGGEFYGGQSVRQITPLPGGTVQVTTGMGAYQASKVVVAAGHGAKRLLAPLKYQLNIFPQRGQLMVSQRCAKILHISLLSICQTMDGTFLIGLSTEDTAMDTRITTEAMKRQAAEAIRFFPELGKLNWVRGWGAIRVMASDGAPIYSQVPGHENIFALALHSAVSLAPLACRKLAPWIMGAEEDPLISQFRNERFHV